MDNKVQHIKFSQNTIIYLEYLIEKIQQSSGKKVQKSKIIRLATYYFIKKCIAEGSDFEPELWSNPIRYIRYLDAREDYGLNKD